MVRIGVRAGVLGTMVALVVAGGTSASLAAGAAPPAGRGYELVSPVDKNGAEVIQQTDKTHVTPDGGGVTFSVLGGFGDLEGSAFDFEYLSRRTGAAGTSGWSTHGINPLGRPATLPVAIDGNGSTFVDGFTPDLSAGIYRAWRPLVAAPNVANVSNLYRLTGLTGGARTVQLLSDAVSPLPDTWFTLARGAFARLIQPVLAGVSTDLRHVVFESRLALTADAPPYAGLCALGGLSCPTKLYENADGLVRLVGRIPQTPDTVCDDVAGPACVAADDSQAALSATISLYSRLAVSADGRRIYFQTPVSPGSGTIYLREDGVRTERIVGDGLFWAASTDGARAFFTTNETLLPADTDGSPDLYMYDREAPAESRFTLISDGGASDPNYVESVVGSSADGSYVYFVCDGQLIAGEPSIGIMGLYVWHDGQLRLVGMLPDINVASDNSPRTNWGLVTTARKSRVAPDGQHVLFMATDDAGLVGRGGFSGYDHAGHQEFYLYDAATGRLACVSCNPTGRAATTDAVIAVNENTGTSLATADSAQALSDDGRRAFFSTAEALVPVDTNGRPDAYEYDAQTGEVKLLSSGKSTAPSYFIDASPSGDDVFIVTRERLVGWDVDDSYDLYDVRIGGGFPEPPAPAPSCNGEACLPGAGSPPVVAPIGSSAYRGAGDAKPKLKRPRRCGRGRVLRTVEGKRKCIRQRAHRRSKRAGRRNERSGR